MAETKQDTAVPAIYAAMAEITGEVGAIGKDSSSPGLNYKFRSADSVMNALNGLMHKHGVVLVTEKTRVKRERRESGKDRDGGARYVTCTEAFVTFRFYSSKDGSSVSAQVFAEAFDLSDKGAAKMHTMALKCLLSQTFLIPTEEPDEGSQTAAGPAVSPETLERLRELLKYNNVDQAEVCAKYGVTSLLALTVSDANMIIRRQEAIMNKKQNGEGPRDTSKGVRA